MQKATEGAATMLHTKPFWTAIAGAFVCLFLQSWGAYAISPDEGERASPTSTAAASLPPTASEARARALLLHEMVHGSLQVIHRDFFDEDSSVTIPSRSLEDVFAEMERSWSVQIGWLAVNTEAMSVENRPQDEFERQAVTALADGEDYFETIGSDQYRFAGPIRLSSRCLKCHVQNRTSLEDRTAGLVISMPIQRTDLPEK